MKATLLERCRKSAGAAIRTEGETATRTTNYARVRLDPGWLGRLLGAQSTVIELAWHEEGFPAHRRGWLAVATGRWLVDLPHARLIRDALDFVPVAEPPRAVAIERVRR